MEKLSEERLKKFKKVMERSKQNIAIILSHIDPDAIACAKIFADICKHLGKIPSIFYSGIIDDPQNNYIYNRFNMSDDFKKLENFKILENKDDFDTVLLDSSSLSDERLEKLKINPIIIIDHHPNENKLEENENSWYWIESFGAAISMVIKVFVSLDLELSTNSNLATLSTIGLLTDSDIKLLSPQMKPLDYDVFHYLSKYMNPTKAKETFDSPFDFKYVRLFVSAYNNIKRNEGKIATYLYKIEQEEIGSLSRLAEELLKIKEIKTIFLWAESNGVLYVKARSEDDTFKLDEELKKYFGKDYAGARHGKGAAAIPLGICAPIDENRDDFISLMEKKFCKMIGI